MLKYRHFLIDLTFLTLIATGFYLAFIESYSLLTPDEGRYAGIAEYMLRHGAWITPKQDGITFLDKPILVYWLEIFSMKLFGINEFAARIVPLCFGVLGVNMTYIAGRGLFNRRTALLAALILMTSPLYFFEAHYSNMDLAVAVLISGALWMSLLGFQLKPGLQRRSYFWVAYVFAALAILTKGLIGIVFPMMIIGLWILCLNEWRQLKHMSLFPGLLIILLLVCPWYFAAEYQTHGFFNYFFVVQQFDRYTGEGFNMMNPVYYYLLIILVGMLPWSIFLPQAIVNRGKQLIGFRKASKTWFLVLWVIMILIFFSIPSSKISSYILPVFPPLAMLIARYCDTQWHELLSKRSTKISLWILGLLMLAVIVAVYVLPGKLLKYGHAPLEYTVCVTAIIFIVVLLGSQLHWLKKSFTRYFTFMFVSSIVIYLSIYAGIRFYAPSTPKTIAKTISRALKPNGIIVAYYTYNADIPFYLNRSMYVTANYWQDPATRLRDDWRSELAKGADLEGKTPLLMNDKTLKQLWSSNQRVIVYTNKDWLSAFKQKIDQHPTILKQIGHDYVLTQGEKNLHDDLNTSTSRQLPPPALQKNPTPESSTQSPPRNQNSSSSAASASSSDALPSMVHDDYPKGNPNTVYTLPSNQIQTKAHWPQHSHPELKTKSAG